MLRMDIVGILIIVAQCLAWSTAQNETSVKDVDFGKTFVGVAFSPYVKNWEVNETSISLPYYNSYGLEEIKIMLRNISTKFQSITTYSMGVADYNVDAKWDEIDSNCLVAKAAAELNRETRNLTITVAQGIHQNSDAKVEQREIENAFTAAAWANQVFPGTVWGLVFMNQPIDTNKGEKLLEIMKHHTAQAAIMGLKIGPRIQNCADVNGGPNRGILLRIVREVDFIMCSQLPNVQAATLGPKKGAQLIFNMFQEYSAVFRTENPNVEIILGETGWPSKGRGYNVHQENNIKKLKTYWGKIAQLSNRNQVRSFLFEAFDEPWKSNYKVHDPNQPGGRFGAEGHFGWWRRVNNDDIYSNVEKIYENVTDDEIPVNTPYPPGVQRSANSTGLIAGIVVGVLLLIFLPVIAFLVFRLRKAKVQIGRLTQREIEEFENGIAQDSAEDGFQELALLLPYNRDYEIPKNKLMIEKNRILGKGEFGMVYKGRIDGRDEDVAFKTVKSADCVNHLRNLMSELKIMIYIGKHDHVISLLGAYTAELRDGVVYIAAEFCSLGSLDKHLRSFSNIGGETSQESPVHYSNVQGNWYANTNEIVDHIPVPQLIMWASQIASGMDWLASKKVIHADLATRNVLLTGQKTVKITDFGLSRRLYEYTNYVKESQEPLPWRWMSIESLRSMNFSSQSDVWSYGVTLWEIFTMGDTPYPGLSWHIEFVQELEKGLRLTCPKYATEAIYEKMLECWRHEPKLRPKFAELVLFFDGLE